jgi:DNA topoisomerase-2
MELDSSMNLAKKYQKKTDKQHILDNPDTYTGTMEKTESQTYIFDSNKIIQKSLTYIPGLFKLFDEAIVNARDHQIRMAQIIQAKNPTKHKNHPVTQISIRIEKSGLIEITNDGNGIDIDKHPEYNIWIPELIFGHLRTSTNYDKNEKKIVGGKNGFGFKLALVWSTWGKIETVDSTRKKKYEQEFLNNLDLIQPPIITSKCKDKPYTKVSFKPELKRLGLNEFSDDMMKLFEKRAYDIAAVTDKKVVVTFNGKQLEIKTFQQYLDLYIGKKEEKERVYEMANERWEYAVCLSPTDEFSQVSFVNGIFTGKGGKHVEYILNQITKKMVALIKKKKKVDVKPNTIKEQLMLFVRCDIENPGFDSQTKDFMSTNISNFGSTCEVSDKFVEKLAKMGVMDAACSLTEIKTIKTVKKNDGLKVKNLRGIPKLIDANKAGTNDAHLCSLILCEGDSAKAGIVSGFEKADRDYWGVYPLKGKLLNVRGETQIKIADNKEISDIKHILGLEVGKKYTPDDVKNKLRYGKVIFMTDQDLDGSHIKGLCINLFDSQWKALTSIPNFIGFMNTPIIKATKKKDTLLFYNDGEYEKWKTDGDTKGWTIKYYKGLGTSTGKEFKEYMAKKKLVFFNKESHDESSSPIDDSDSIDMAFNKQRACDRKKWLEAYNKSLYLDTNKKAISYYDFIHKEMIHFSKYDCERSIPNLMDGLKTSLRKILYVAFLRNLTHEIKVAQFSGSVSEKACYHHGEASLNGAIIGLAQNFTGSNNINLLKPNGQFGTRLQGGKDSASERYIFTELENITRYIFLPQDDNVLNYLEDDGTKVEPDYYAPIIPMILVNGSKGIGTGFSTDILSYNPKEIIDYIKSSLLNKDLSTYEMLPYYKGFTGEIKRLTNNKFLMKGKYEKLGARQIRITELPIGIWTDDYKKFIEDLMEGGSKKTSKVKTLIKDYNENGTESVVNFELTFGQGVIEELEGKIDENGCNGLEKYLKLFTTKTTTNMNLFDENGKLRSFERPQDILDYFINIRKGIYVKRKKYIIDSLKRELTLLSNKARYITEIVTDIIDLRKKKKQDIMNMLAERKYAVIDEDSEYKYLVKMPMDMVNEENIEKLLNDKNCKETALEIAEKTSEDEMWIQDLNALNAEYDKFASSQLNEEKTKEKTKEKKKKVKLVVK